MAVALISNAPVYGLVFRSVCLEGVLVRCAYEYESTLRITVQGLVTLLILPIADAANAHLQSNNTYWILNTVQVRCDSDSAARRATCCLGTMRWFWR